MENKQLISKTSHWKRNLLVLIIVSTIFFVGCLLFLLLTNRIVFVPVAGENRLLVSKVPITDEFTKVIPISSSKGGYYSEHLQIYIPLFYEMSGMEHLGIITIREKNKAGEIKIERYKTNYTSLEDAENRTKNMRLKNAVKHNFDTVDHVDGRVYDVKDPDTRIYSLYFDQYIYNFETTDPNMYKSLKYIASQARYQIPESPSKDFSTQEPKWILKRELAEGSKEVFEFEKNGLNYIVRWKDTLLYTYMYGENSVLSLYQHNIKTGKTQTIFSKTTEELLMGEPTIVNDVLYISLGAYLQRGESYWIELNNSDKRVHKLADIGGSVVKIKDRYYFVYGEGDACWGSRTYSLIDITTKEITKVADTAIGCIPGDEYLGINDSDQMILSTFINTPESKGYGYQEANLYTNVILISLSTPSIRKYAIAPYAMPPGILRIEYSDEQGKILMVGDSIYIYSFNTAQVEKVVDLPKEWAEHKADIRLIGWKGTIVCVSKYDRGGEELANYQINTETKQISLDMSECPTGDTKDFPPADIKFPETKTEKVKRIFQELDLPSGYTLIKK